MILSDCVDWYGSFRCLLHNPLFIISILLVIAGFSLIIYLEKRKVWGA